MGETREVGVFLRHLDDAVRKEVFDGPAGQAALDVVRREP